MEKRGLEVGAQGCCSSKSYFGFVVVEFWSTARPNPINLSNLMKARHEHRLGSIDSSPNIWNSDCLFPQTLGLHSPFSYQSLDGHIEVMRMGTCQRWDRYGMGCSWQLVTTRLMLTPRDSSSQALTFNYIFRNAEMSELSDISPYTSH